MREIEVRQLDCGVRVIMEQIPYVESVAMGIWVKAGSVDEDKKNAGVSHFIEHMTFEGTSRRTAREIAEDMDRIGGQMNAFTSKEATCYYAKVVKDNFEKGAEILLDMLTGSIFEKSAMDKERQVICEEIKMIEDQPEDLVSDTIGEMMFKGHPLGNSITGTPTSLSRISRNVLTAYREAEYTRDSIVVALAGNMDEDRVCDYLEGKFDSLKASKPKKNVPEAEYRKSCKVLVKDIKQSHLCMAVKGIAMDDPRYYAFGILNNIMGGSMSSRLFQNIREEKGLAYSIYSMTNSYSDGGYFNIYAGVSHDKIRQAIEGIKEELRILDREGVTEEELSTSREQFKSEYIFSQENVTSRMFGIGRNLLMLDKVITADEILSRLNAVTMDDIDEVRELICDIDRYSAAVVTDRRIDLKGMMEG